MVKGKCIVAACCMLFFLACNNPSGDDQLGTAFFEVDGKPEAVDQFNKGLLLLHSFEFKDAAEAFIQAQQLDPNIAMAYWGEAMTYNHPLWAEQDYDKAIAALKKLAPTPAERLARAGNGLEAGFMRAVDILYGEGSKFARDKAYAEYMAQLHEKYPDNQEVAAFYALSLLGSVPVGRDEEVYEKGAIIAKGILEENPNHPGALHYLIHAYDDPNHAYDALGAANSYSQVASAAAHALHMPSHIYVALGMWDKVVASNEVSFQASVDRKARKSLNNDALGYHSLQWLEYGYLQQGRISRATEIAKDMQTYVTALPSGRARVHMILIKGAYLIDTENYQSEIAGIDVRSEDLNISIHAMNNFIEGLKQLANNDIMAAKATADAMESDRKKVTIQLQSDGLTLCSSVGWENQAANQLDIDQASIMEMELRAMIADRNNDATKAEEWLRQATELESKISYSYGPPAVLKPSHELYGEWLLEQARPKDALDQFEYGLKRAPMRVKLLQGELEAAEALSLNERAAEIRSQLDKILAQADKGNSLASL